LYLCSYRLTLARSGFGWIPEDSVWDLTETRRYWENFYSEYCSSTSVP